MQENFDVIVIGARVGGSPLAMLLARAGRKVLMVDRMEAGSDIMSTHYLKRTGGAMLQKWGLMDGLKRRGVQEIGSISMDLDGDVICGVPPVIDGVSFDVTPRRFVLDNYLAEAAAASGVDYRDRFKVTEIILNGDRVTGVRGVDSDGKEVIATANVVVGADGVRSLLAKAVGAEHHIDEGIHNCGYYAYFSGMRQEFNRMSIWVRTEAKRFYITFPTNNDLDMVFLFWPSDEAVTVKKDVEAAFFKSLDLVPQLRSRVMKGTRETRFTGTNLFHNFFRRAHGPGWALVGDAAIHRDPITAQGITNAFTHAEILAEELNVAFDRGGSLDAALERYDKRQIEKLKPMFDHTVHAAQYQPLSPSMRMAMPAIAANPAATTALLGAILDSTSASEVYRQLEVAA